MYGKMVLAACVALAGCDGADEESAPPSTATASSSLPALNDADAKLAVAAVESADERARSRVAANALADIERTRLPSGLLKGITAWVHASPDDRSRLMAESIVEHIALLDKVCATPGEAIMKKLAVLAVDERRDYVWDTCTLERHGLLTKAQHTEADGDLTVLLLGHMAFEHLGPASKEETMLLRTMMLGSEPERTRDEG